jgi:putative endonuclease
VYFVYVMASERYGTLYIGVTNNLKQRVWQHKQGVVDGFSKKYGVNQLVYFERFTWIQSAIDREKKMKKWNRSWKVRLIEQANPDWKDLFETL